MLTAKIVNLIIALWCVLISAVQAVNWTAAKTELISLFDFVLKSPAVKTTAGLVFSLIIGIIAAHLLCNLYLFVIPNKIQKLVNVRAYLQEKWGQDFKLAKLVFPTEATYTAVNYVYQKSRKFMGAVIQVCGISGLFMHFKNVFKKIKTYFFIQTQRCLDKDFMLVSRDWIFGYYGKAGTRRGARVKVTIETGRLIYYLQFFTQPASQKAQFGTLWCLDLKRLMVLSITVRLLLSFGVSGWRQLWCQLLSGGGVGISGSAFLEPSDLDTPNHHTQNYWNNTEFGNRLRANLRRNHLGHPNHLFDPRRYLGPKAPNGDLWEIWIGRLIEGCGNDFKIVSVRNEYTEKTQLGWFYDRVIKLGCFVFIMLSLFFFYSALCEGKYVRAIRKYGDKIEGQGGDND